MKLAPGRHPRCWRATPRTVVAPRGQVRRLWREDADLGPTKIKLVARLVADHAYTQCLRLLNQNFHFWIRRIASHNSRGPKLARTAAAPPMWSARACVMATASRRLMARDHRYGDTTSSPISKSECAQCGRPPASTSRVRPPGDTSKIESPWPTSIAVISSTAERICERGGTTAIQS